MKRLLTLILASLLMLSGCADVPEEISEKKNVIAEAEYPVMAPYPSEADYYDEKNGDFDYEAYEADHTAWQKTVVKTDSEEIRTIISAMTPFVQKTAAQLLNDARTENRVYSPLNLYFALGLLAEITGGNSRAQILDVMEIESVEILRQRLSTLWKANYRTDGTMNSVFANSLWLDRRISFRQETLDLLAETYYASSYSGDMGSPEFEQGFRNWLKEQTGGLLEKQADSLEFPEDSLLALASTVYYSAKWQYQFSEKFTEEQVFHAPSGDINCDFLYKEDETSYYYGENYAAVSLPFNGNANNKMWFILPDEDVTVTDLLNDDEVSSLYLTGKGSSVERIVHIRIPKFDISSDVELSDTLRSLGITDIFDPASADFSPLTKDFSGEIGVDSAKHAVRVAIDEEGCTAAAYTVVLLVGAAPPPDEEVEITFDRPFLFVITGSRNTVLFMGIVNDPTGN